MKSLLLVLALASVASAGMMPKELLDTIKCIKFAEACWSQKVIKEWFENAEEAMKTCLMKEPTFTESDFFLEPNSDVEANDIDDDHISKFIEKFEEVKEMKVDAISNLTCVMKELKLWNEDRSINIDYYTGEMLNELPMDKELIEMMRQGYKHCYKFSEALPVEDMKNPIKKMFGKQLIFQKCTVKMEEKLCAMKEISEYMEEKYGVFTSEKAERMGLPDNKYQASLMAKLVMMKSMPVTKKFVMSTLMTGVPSFM